MLTKNDESALQKLKGGKLKTKVIISINGPGNYVTGVTFTVAYIHGKQGTKKNKLPITGTCLPKLSLRNHTLIIRFYKKQKQNRELFIKKKQKKHCVSE